MSQACSMPGRVCVKHAACLGVCVCVSSVCMHVWA